MSNNMLNRILIILLTVLFIGTSIIPSISSDYNNEQVTLSLTFYTFDKTGTKECNVELSTDTANIISDMFEELKCKIINDPTSSKTKSFFKDFVEMLDIYDLIPRGLSKNYVSSLLNPRWLHQSGNNNPVSKSSIPHLRTSTFRNDVLPMQSPNTGSAIFCSLAGTGRGLIFTPIMFPRPRFVSLWSSFSSAFSTAANLYTGHGFVASGGQTGIAFGFWGVGLSFAFPGEPAVFGFGGYALLALVRADDIETYPLNQKPVISEENPLDGDNNVPISLSELSFKIEDADGDRMSYTVTTDPDIGGGMGSGYNGVYSVNVDNLEIDKSYRWSVEVTDGEDVVVKIFNFITECVPPFDPFSEGWKYRKRITINHSKVSSDFSNFPVLISVVDSDLHDKAQVDGDDILFMRDIGVASKIYHEIEKYDSSAGKLVTWVNVPTISDDEDTSFYMYFGNLGCSSQENAARTWNSNYEAVFHFDEESGGIKDSTSNGYYGIAGGDPEYHQTDALTGGYSIYFDSGEDDYFDDVFPESSINPLIDSGHTIEIWCKFDGIPSEDNTNVLWFCHNEGSSKRYYCMARNGQYYTNLREGGKFWGTLDNTDWHHVLIDINSGYDWFAYLDKVHLKTKENFGDYNLGEPVDIAGNDGENGWIGWIDELRLSNVQRSQAWRDATYETIIDPSNFLSFGPEESIT